MLMTSFILITSCNQNTELANEAVTIVLEDSKGTIWIGCAGGLFRLTENGVVNVTTNGPWK